MRNPPLILAVDDTPENLDILCLRLESNGYAVETAVDGLDALDKARRILPDLILLDVMMPRLDGIATVRTMKSDPDLSFIPVIMVTSKSDLKDVIEGLDAGGDDYVTKPFEHQALLARVRAMLRLKELHDTVRMQATKLEQQSQELAAWNGELERRVAEQVSAIGRMNGLRRFLPRRVADLLIEGSDDPLKSHRADVTVVFGDLRDFTAFTETAEPEEVISVLRDYHARLGTIIMRYDGTLERFAGDGLLVLFNDPLPQADHVSRAVTMALEMRDVMAVLLSDWRRSGHQLGFGIGIASGYATVGGVGFEDRLDYSVVGSVPNLAARLCDEARDGQILATRRVATAVERDAEAHLVGVRDFKGFHRPVQVFDLATLRSWDLAAE